MRLTVSLEDEKSRVILQQDKLTGSPSRPQCPEPY
jgi:hypothetical protein